MPLTQPLATPAPDHKPLPVITETPNRATCVTHVQFNIGQNFCQLKYMADVKGEKRVTLTADREMRGKLLISCDPFAMSNLKVSVTNLQLFLIGSDRKHDVGEPVKYMETHFCGFKTPELSLVFGEQDVFSLMYTTVFGTEEVLQITVACMKPSLDDHEAQP